MIYVIGDIHGRLDLFERMLDLISLKEDDTLYILGDCVDRGGGIAVLQRIMELQKKYNVKMLLGNHEKLFLLCTDLHINDTEFLNVIEQRNKYQKEAESLKRSEDTAKAAKDSAANNSMWALLQTWGAVQYAMQRLKATQAANEMIEKEVNSVMAMNHSYLFDNWETLNEYESLPVGKRRAIKTFLSGLPYTAKVQIGDKCYLLVHGGLYAGDNPDAMYYPRDEFFMQPVDKELLAKHGCPEDTTVIFGHTTTRDLNIWTNHVYKVPGSIWYDEEYKDKIGIDCGASYPNGQLACLRLDDMQEFYVRNEDRFITPLEKVNQFFSDTRQFWDDESAV
ncbi:MAG: metallophosphoesterase [Clostridiales bacterium]|nr:metallophosphoesterase [Clostridiales bacterium]